MTANGKRNSKNSIVPLQVWIDETLPALEHIMVRIGLFTIFAVGLVTIVRHLMKH